MLRAPRHHGGRAISAARRGRPPLGHGRKDNLLVTANGRNISPEWIEAVVMSDPRVAACVLLGHGMSHLSLLLVPSPHVRRVADGLASAHILLWLEQICIDAPSYAVPKDFVVCPAAQAKRIGLLTSNGPRRARGCSWHLPRAQAREASSGRVRPRRHSQAMEGTSVVLRSTHRRN